MKQEFRVRWTEDTNQAAGKRRDRTGRINWAVSSNEDRQVKKMREVKRRLDKDGFKLSHTDEQGYMVYVKESA